MLEYDLLKTLSEAGLSCTGCAACSNVCPRQAIEMPTDKLGFRYPRILSELCVDCGLCRQSCPVLSGMVSPHASEPECYAVQATPEVRKGSSSGGAFTLLAQAVLAQGGVVFGAAMGEDLTVRHLCVSTQEKLATLRKSKYVQSDIGWAYRKAQQYLEQGKQVLFSGTPCQIAGLYACVGYGWNTLYTVDILCHGVPSQQMLQDSLQEGTAGHKIVAVDFRDKQFGWECLGMTLLLDNGAHRRLSYDESRYEQGFHPNMTLRESCFHCPFSKYPRMGDLTIGDFWHVADYNPDFADGHGTSALLVNSERGRRLLEAIHSQATLLEPVPLSYLESNRVTPDIPKPPEREIFLSLYPGRPFNQSVLDAQQNRHDVGIVGNWSYPNYGSELTYYALYRTVTELGYTAVMLSWPGDSQWKPYDHVQLFARDPYPRRDVAAIPATRADLVNYNARCDTFLLGSDQLLNDNLYNRFGRFAQLDWVYSNKKKIAYAVSFGTDFIWGPDEDRAELAHFLQELDFVSSREDSGCSLLRERFGVTAQQVLDPVFLPPVTLYQELAELGQAAVPQTPYLFTYVLDRTSVAPELLQQCSEQLNLPLFSVADAAPEEHRQPGESGYSATLEEWIACIQGCSCMITDSFHGMCMAILMHRPFVALCNDSRGAARFDSILSLLGLKERLLASGAQLAANLYLLHQAVNYDAVERHLVVLRRQSMDWLQNALSARRPAKALSTFDLLDRRIRALDHQTTETDAKQWQQLEDHRDRLDRMSSRLEELERQLNELSAHLEETNQSKHRSNCKIDFIRKCIHTVSKNPYSITEDKD